MIDSVQFSVTDEGVSYWHERPYLSDDLRANLSNSDVILVPWEQQHGEDIVFPAGTTSFFQYLQSKLSETGLTLEIGVEDADYREISLHSDWLLIAHTVATMAVAPIVTSIIANYIYDTLGKRRADKATVKSKLTVELKGDRKSVKIDYDGPAKTYEETVQTILKTIAGTDSLAESEIDNGDA